MHKTNRHETVRPARHVQPVHEIPAWARVRPVSRSTPSREILKNKILQNSLSQFRIIIFAKTISSLIPIPYHGNLTQDHKGRQARMYCAGRTASGVRTLCAGSVQASQPAKAQELLKRRKNKGNGICLSTFPVAASLSFSQGTLQKQSNVPALWCTVLWLLHTVDAAGSTSCAGNRVHRGPLSSWVVA